MKKPALIAAAIALVLVAGTPWVFGALARQRVAAGIERLDAEAEIDAEVVASSGGWVASTTTVAFELPQAALAEAAQADDVTPQLSAMLAFFEDPVRLEVTLEHGPVLFGDGVSLGLAASTIRLDPATPGYQELLDELGIPYLFEIRSRTGFDGRSDFVSEVPRFDYTNDQVTIAFSGSRSTGSYDAALRRVAAQGAAASLRVTAPDGMLELQGIEFDTDSTRHNELLRLGRAAASVARITASAPGERFEIEDLAVRFDVDLDASDERATLAADYRLARLSDGADVDLTGLEVVATARSVDVDALTAYSAAVRDAGFSDDPSAPLSLDLEDAIYELLVASPVIDLAPVRFNWNGEPLDATLRIAFDGARMPERTNFTALVLAFNGVMSVELTLDVSESLANVIAARGIAFQVRRGAEQDGIFMTDEDIDTIASAQAAIAIAQLAAQGMLLPTPTGFSTIVRFTGGALTVNGNPIPLGFP